MGAVVWSRRRKATRSQAVVNVATGQTRRIRVAFTPSRLAARFRSDHGTRRDELADVKTCLQCGYDLRGLALSRRRGRCAECGNRVDPRTLVIPAWRWGKWPRRWNVPFYCLILLNSLALLALASMIPLAGARNVLGGMALLGTGGALWSLFNFIWRVRGRAEGRLVVFRRGVAFAPLRKPPRGFALRDISWFRVRRLGAQHWRVKMSLFGGSVDVVIKGDRRRMAAIRAVLKQRMGHTGITGWGTRRRSPWSLPSRTGGGDGAAAARRAAAR